MCGRSWAFWPLLVLFFALVSPSVSAQDQAPSPSFVQKVNALRSISQRADRIAQELSLRLISYEKQIGSLESDLARARDELTMLRESLREQSSRQLLSAQEFTELSATAQSLQDSLDRSTEDFLNYKQTSEATIRGLQNEHLLWAGGGVVAGAVIIETLHLLGVLK